MFLSPLGCNALCANGYLFVYMHFKPEIAHNYWDAIKSNDIKVATEIIDKYAVPFMEELLAQLNLNFDATIHAVMEI